MLRSTGSQSWTQVSHGTAAGLSLLAARCRWPRSPAPPTAPSRSSPFLEAMVTQLRAGVQVGGHERGPWVWTDRSLAQPPVSSQVPLWHFWKAPTVQAGGLPRHPGRPSAAPRKRVPTLCPPWRGSCWGGLLRVFHPALPAKTQGPGQKSDAGAGAPAAARSPSIGALAGLECAVRGTGVSFMLGPGAAKERVIKCHIQWGLRSG